MENLTAIARQARRSRAPPPAVVSSPLSRAPSQFPTSGAPAGLDPVTGASSQPLLMESTYDEPDLMPRASTGGAVSHVGSSTSFRKKSVSIPAVCVGIIAAIGVIKLAPRYKPAWFEDKRTGEVSRVRVHMAGALLGVVAWGAVQLALNFRKA
eukprot:jgi/Mesvir1/18330/Mv18483-RA.1